MLTLVSGLPGHGKTLNTIADIDTRIKDRPIYYLSKGSVDEPGAGIAGLTLNNFQPFIEYENWFDLPDSSVILIDEAQYIFPANKVIKVPEYFEQLTEHRKKGFDLYLITQDIKNLHPYVRRLAGEHIHYHRPFGASRTVKWVYQRAVDPFSKAIQKEAIARTVVKFPERYFSVYQSANTHTVKRQLPLKLFYLPVLLILLVVSLYAAYSVLTPDEKVMLAPPVKTDQVPVIPVPASSPQFVEEPDVLDYEYYQQFMTGIDDDHVSHLPANCSVSPKSVKCFINRQIAYHLATNYYCVAANICYFLVNRISKPVDNTDVFANLTQN